MIKCFSFFIQFWMRVVCCKVKIHGYFQSSILTEWNTCKYCIEVYWRTCIVQSFGVFSVKLKPASYVAVYKKIAPYTKQTILVSWIFLSIKKKRGKMYADPSIWVLPYCVTILSSQLDAEFNFLFKGTGNVMYNPSSIYSYMKNVV